MNVEISPECRKVADEAAPHVEAALRERCNTHDHLRAINPALIAAEAAKIVSMLPTIVAVAQAAGFQLPALAVNVASFAVDLYSVFSKNFPSIAPAAA